MLVLLYSSMPNALRWLWLISMGDGRSTDSRFSQPWVLANILILLFRRHVSHPLRLLQASSTLHARKQQPAAASIGWLVAQRPKTALVGLCCMCMSPKSSAPCAGIMLYHKLLSQRLKLETASLAPSIAIYCFVPRRVY